MASKTKVQEETVETKVIHPKDLAETLGVNPKNLRRFLRGAYPRTPENKNTSWTLTEDMVKAATDHFTASDDETTEDEA